MNPNNAITIQQKAAIIAQKFGDRATFLTEFNPSKQMDICTSYDLCFFGSYPTLAELNEAFGKKMAMAWLIPQLCNLSEYCGVREKFTNLQLEELSFIISSTYPYLKVSELMLFFRNFKAGKYGKFYGSVDPLIIMDALRNFTIERCRAIERKEQEDRAREEEEHRKKAITWEEYCRRVGKDPLDTPLRKFFRT